MGVIASMALMPVCNGSWTGVRPTMPGAWTSRRRSSVALIGPLPSTGSPSGFTTRPISASPTGTDRMRPVARTAAPSSISSTSPSTTAPIESSSRFSARPSMPPSNSSSSFTAVSGRPATRAMPSPTRSTRPTCPFASDGWNVSTCLRSAAAISSALIVSSGMSDLLLQLLEAVAHRAVDDDVTDARHDPAEHGRVDHDLDLHLLPGRAGERGGESLLLTGVERHRAADLGDLLIALLRGLADEAIDDHGQVVGAARGDDHPRERDRRGQRLAAHQLLDHRDAPLRGERLVGQRHAQVVEALERAGEPVELVLDVREVALRPGHLQERVGVRLDAVAHTFAPAMLMVALAARRDTRLAAARRSVLMTSLPGWCSSGSEAV